MKIEFIIPTYKRVDHLMAIISSIYAQTSKRWFIHVVADCPPEGTLDKVMKFYDDPEKIKYTILPKRYNDWGHTPRNYGLENAKEDWVVMTGEDNYYMPTFVEEFLTYASHNVHFVFCDMVHNWINNQYIYLPSKLQYGKIDIGNFMTKTKISKRMKLNEKIEQADYLFVEEYLKNNTGKIVHISKILYVHN